MRRCDVAASPVRDSSGSGWSCNHTSGIPALGTLVATAAPLAPARYTQAVGQIIEHVPGHRKHAVTHTTSVPRHAIRLLPHTPATGLSACHARGERRLELAAGVEVRVTKPRGRVVHRLRVDHAHRHTLRAEHGDVPPRQVGAQRCESA